MKKKAIFYRKIVDVTAQTKKEAIHIMGDKIQK